MLSIIGPVEYRVAAPDSHVRSFLRDNNTSGTCTNTGTLRNEGEHLCISTTPIIRVQQGELLHLCFPAFLLLLLTVPLKRDC